MIKFNEPVVVIVMALFVLLFGILVGMRLYDFCKTHTGKPLQKLNEFIKSDYIIGIAKDTIANVIDSTDFSKYKNFQEAQAELFQNAYDEVWSLIQSQLDKKFGNDKLYHSVMKVFTRSVIEEYVNELFVDRSIQEKVNEIIQEEIDNDTEDILLQEKKLSEEALEYEKSTEETGDVRELDPTRVQGGIEDADENLNLNPPTEHEETKIDVDDGTVEVVEESEVVLPEGETLDATEDNEETTEGTNVVDGISGIQD